MVVQKVLLIVFNDHAKKQFHHKQYNNNKNAK